LRRVVETNEGERQTAQPPSFALTPVLTSAEASLRRFCPYHLRDLHRRAPHPRARAVRAADVRTKSGTLEAVTPQ
jgi:hypothetical protein